MAAMNDVLIGLDVGTTAAKAVAFDLAGTPLAGASVAYGLHTPQPGWVEQDPEDLWRGVVTVLHSVAAQLGPDQRVLALAQSSQGGTTIPVDETGQPVCDAISWMDQRSTTQAEATAAQVGGEFIRSTTGWALGPILPLHHIGWLRDNRPDLFARARSYLFVNDFIGARLTGTRFMNPTDAGITQLYGIAAGDWAQGLLELAGIRREQLSPLYPVSAPVGALTADAAAVTGLPAGLLIANGAHDQYCAAVGTGVMRPGSVLLSCGTAWVVLAVLDDLSDALRSGMAVGPHVRTGLWGGIRSLGGLGASMEWLMETLSGDAAGVERATKYAALDAAASRAAPGAGGLLCFPFAGGHGALFGPARGGFVRLTLGHTRGDLARAVMEGAACELRWALEEMQETGNAVTELRMVGGAARSPAWPQIIADLTGLPVVLPAMHDAACAGAAIVAGVAAGCFRDPEVGYDAFRGSEKRLSPDPTLRSLYDATFSAYRDQDASQMHNGQ
jgi:xylulokinase